MKKLSESQRLCLVHAAIGELHYTKGEHYSFTPDSHVYVKATSPEASRKFFGVTDDCPCNLETDLGGGVGVYAVELRSLTT